MTHARERLEHSIPDAVLRELAVDAKVCPRTVAKVYRGEPVRGDAGRRARVALERAGLLRAP